MFEALHALFSGHYHVRVYYSHKELLFVDSWPSLYDVRMRQTLTNLWLAKKGSEYCQCHNTWSLRWIPRTRAGVINAVCWPKRILPLLPLSTRSSRIFPQEGNGEGLKGTCDHWRPDWEVLMRPLSALLTTWATWNGKQIKRPEVQTWHWDRRANSVSIRQCPK